MNEKAYRVERAAREDDGVPAAYADIIGALKVGDVVTTADLYASLGDRLSTSAGRAAKKAKLRKAMMAAKRAGIVADVTPHGPTQYKEFLDIPSVAQWIGQLNQPSVLHGRTKGGGKRDIYGHALHRFSSWLHERPWSITTRTREGGAYREERQDTEIRDVGHMLELALERGGVDRDLSVIVRQFFAEMETQKRYSASGMRQMRSAIKSFFISHEIPYALELPRYRTRGTGRGSDAEKWENCVLKMSELARMLSVGNPTVRDKAVLLAKFHCGLDLSTLTDRFNYTAFDQIAKHMGSDDHRAWDLDKCPVPITLTRVKTNVNYIGFLEMDAMSANIDWIVEREYLTGRPLRRGDGQALYITQCGNPIGPAWVSRRFRTLAVRVGLCRKADGRYTEVTRHSHQLRHLLKSTLIDAGCRIDIADHVIGHSSKDTHEKQTVLYPESIRREYAKAADKINIFTNFESSIDAIGDIHQLRAEARAYREQLKEVLAAAAADRERAAAGGALRTGGLDASVADIFAALNEDVRMLKEESGLGGIGGIGIGGREYQCIACSLVHASSTCPACGSPERRMTGAA